MSTILQEVAERFGLAADPGGGGILGFSRLRGVIDGQKVVCALTDRGARLEGIFEPALDLGLDVSTRQVTFIPTIGRKIAIGDSGFDEELDATADEPGRAALLFAGALRGAVLGLNATNMGLEMTDERVTVMAPLYDLKAAIDGLPKVARVAAMVAEARRSVPPAGPLNPYSEALGAFGRARGFQVEKTPLSAVGRLRDAAVSARCVRTGRTAFDMEVRAAVPGGGDAMGLYVRRESLLDRARTLLGGQDLRTGDPAFDPVFLVQATDAERAVAALDGDVRALLLDLAARFDSVLLTGPELMLLGAVQRVRAADMEMVLEAASTVVERVVRASGAVLRGPYR